MIPLLWSKEIYGSVHHSDADSIITAPGFSDGHGWWARYQHDTGELLWRRHHRRAACLFAVVNGVIVATTHKYSGVYALSLQKGEKLWFRLGDRADWLLKLFEYLPCDNEGDGPDGIQNGRILTRRGRLLDLHSCAIVSRRSTESGRGAASKVGGMSRDPVGSFDFPPRYRYGGIPVQPGSPDSIDHSLKHEGLETSGPQWCLIEKPDHAFVIACKPPDQYRTRPRSRLYQPAPPSDVAHYLMIIRRTDNEIIYREELGCYYSAEIAWADETTLAITLQKKEQRVWSCRYDLRVYDVAQIPRAR